MKPSGHSQHSETLSPSMRTSELRHQITTDPIQLLEIINKNELHNYKLGICFIVIAITTWVAGLELVNAVMKGDDYNKPVSVAVYTGSCFSLYYLQDLYSLISTGIRRHFKGPYATKKSESAAQAEVVPFNSPEQLTRPEIVALAFKIAVCYLLYNICVMESLQYTSASNQTVLSSTTSIFTLVIGVLVKTDRISFKKVLCVTISTVGVLLVNMSESANEPDSGSKFLPKNPLLGNTFAMLGAFMYSAYMLVMKVNCGMGKKTTNERQLFGLVGVFTILIGVPIVILADQLDFEKFEFPPPSNNILFSILANGLFSVISDYCIVMAMLLTSPLIASLSLTSAIPITICIDFIILLLEDIENPNSSKNFIYYLGIMGILLSVVLINVNISSENEFIGEVIEETLEEAISEDEVLSPMLSPLLDPNSGRLISPFASSVSPRFESSFQIGTSGSEILAKLSPKILHRLQVRNQQPDITSFNLNTNSEYETAPLANLNHSSDLYVIDEQLSSDRPGTPTKIVVYSRAHHSYYIKNIEESEEV